MASTKGLNTYQLQEALQGNKVTQPCFDGIYAANRLNEIEARPHLIIVNTDPDYKPGQHWLLLNFLSSHVVELFDSLGKDVEDYPRPIRDFVYRFSTQVHQMPYRVQPLYTALCGHYCLYYAYCSCTGERMEDIVKHIPHPDWIRNCIPILFNIPHIKSECQSCCNQ